MYTYIGYIIMLIVCSACFALRPEQNVLPINYINILLLFSICFAGGGGTAAAATATASAPAPSRDSDRMYRFTAMIHIHIRSTEQRTRIDRHEPNYSE